MGEGREKVLSWGEGRKKISGQGSEYPCHPPPVVTGERAPRDRGAVIS